MPEISPTSDRNRRTALLAAGGALAMLGLGFASVPLYRIFCQVTGFDGTTQRVSALEAARVKAISRIISVRFDANVEAGMAWRFTPEQVTQQMRIGERKMAYFRAENISNKTITGVASFNVQPDLVGLYFKKIQCFCFTQQTLKPGQVVDMPVIYYVDPAILTNPETARIQQITLSYTFHVSPDQSGAVEANAKALDRVASAR